MVLEVEELAQASKTSSQGARCASLNLCEGRPHEYSTGALIAIDNEPYLSEALRTDRGEGVEV